MFCPECGNKNEDGAVFCGECGTKLVANHQTEETNQTSPVTKTPVYTQQPPTVRQQQVQQPMPKAKKKMSGGAIAMIVELFLAVALVVSLVLVINNQTSPKKVAEEYWKATMELKWSQAYNYCDFPDGEFMSKQMYINAMSTGEEKVEYNAYEIYDLSEQAEEMVSAISEYLPENVTNAAESNIQKTYYISYVPKGGSDKVTEVVTLSKTKEKKFLFWTQWKVTAADCITSNVNVEVPLGAKVTFNDVELSKDWVTEEDSIARYTIPSLFTGEYQVEVTMEGMAPYRMLYNTYEGGIFISHLEPTEEIKEQVGAQLVADAQAIVQAAVDGKKFETVEEYFAEYAIEDNSIEDDYEDLMELAGQEENSGLVSYEASDIIVSYESCDYTEEGMIISLSAKGNYKLSKWRDWFFSTPELRDYDGEMSMWVTYVNVDGEWKLTDLPLDYSDF